MAGPQEYGSGTANGPYGSSSMYGSGNANGPSYGEDTYAQLRAAAGSYTNAYPPEPVGGSSWRGPYGGQQQDGNLPYKVQTPPSPSGSVRSMRQQYGSSDRLASEYPPAGR